MKLTLFKGYPDLIGRRQAFCGSGPGPSSYSQATGDPLSLTAYERYFDCVNETPQDPTGTYFAQARPTLAGARATWSLHWYVVSTGAEVANGVNLSTFNVIVSGYMGEY